MDSHEEVSACAAMQSDPPSAPAGLRALTRQRHGEPFVQALQYAQQVTRLVPYDDLDRAIRTLDRAHAFDDVEGARLRLPTPEPG